MPRPKSESKRKHSVNIRLTDEEYEAIKEVSFETGRPMAELLRSAFFYESNYHELPEPIEEPANLHPPPPLPTARRSLPSIPNALEENTSEANNSTKTVNEIINSESAFYRDRASVIRELKSNPTFLKMKALAEIEPNIEPNIEPDIEVKNEAIKIPKRLNFGSVRRLALKKFTERKITERKLTEEELTEKKSTE